MNSFYLWALELREHTAACPIAIALTILRIVTLFLINETGAIGILYDPS
ncbi:hypothetical protein [Microcoleus sp. herbarium14]